WFTETFFLEPRGDFLLGFGCWQQVDRRRIERNPVASKRFSFGPSADTLCAGRILHHTCHFGRYTFLPFSHAAARQPWFGHHMPNLQSKLLRKLEIALVMRGDGHDRA